MANLDLFIDQIQFKFKTKKVDSWPLNIYYGFYREIFCWPDIHGICKLGIFLARFFENLFWWKY